MEIKTKQFGIRRRRNVDIAVDLLLSEVEGVCVEVLEVVVNECAL